MLAPLIDADLRNSADGEPEIRRAEAAREKRLCRRQAIKCTIFAGYQSAMSSSIRNMISSSSSIGRLEWDDRP